MEKVKVAPGERAPVDSDCIRIDRLPDGKYGLSASALDGLDSVAVVGSGPYDSRDEAEAAGVAWAASHDVALLYIEYPAAKGLE